MPAPTAPRRPGSTLLIPVHGGREAMVQAQLASVAAAQRSAMYPVEVLVITQDIPAISALLQAAFPQFPIPIRTAVCYHATTLGQLRNAGLRAVTTEWLHSADSDTVFPSEYFVQLERAMMCWLPSVSCFQLNFAPLPGGSCWACYEAEIDQRVLARYIGTDGVQGLNGMNFVARPDLLLSLGGFAEDLVSAEDVEFGYRLAAAGVQIVFLPEVRILHHYPQRLAHILRRKFWHGQGYAYVFQRCPTLFRRRWEWRADVRRCASPTFACYYFCSHLAFLAGMCASWLSKRQQHRA